MRKKTTLILAGVLLSSLITTNASLAGSAAAEYLLNYGINFYEKGRYNDALIEFKEVLLIDPENKLAKKYISEIFAKTTPQERAATSAIKEVSGTQRSRSSVATTPTQPQAEVMAKKNLERQMVIENTFNGLAKQISEEKKLGEEPSEEANILIGKVRISGEVQSRIGVTSEDDFYWRRANWDLNEKDLRKLSHSALDQGINTYDPRIYDRLSLYLNSGEEEGFAFHSNIVADPWSYTGKSEDLYVTNALGRTVKIKLKYWSNSGYTINDYAYVSPTGDLLKVPEIRVRDGETKGPVTVRSIGGQFFTIPRTEVERQFQPMRELWLDYKQDGLKFRAYPIAYENQEKIFDDPLVLSGNHIWWENSPWINSWRPGFYNSAALPAADFTKGYWDNADAYRIRDSEGRRLTALRGFSFDWQPAEKSALTMNLATPKSPWQDYSDADNVLSAVRFSQGISDNLSLGFSGTGRVGFNVDDEHNLDAQNYVLGADLRFEVMEGVMASIEGAYSDSKYDLSNDQYKSKSQGNAYYVCLIGRYPFAPIIDTKFGYNGIQPTEDEGTFTKFRFFASHMDESFDAPLSSYAETRNDEFWSRHIHFREPFKYYYQGEGRLLTWDDIKVNRVGNGIDYGRNTIGIRIESLFFDKKLENFFDVRNVRNTDGKFIENVLRDEISWKITDKLTGKFLGLYNRLPHTKALVDPFLYDPVTREYYQNNTIVDGKDPSIATGSIGLNYDFFDWLGLNGIWEYTNDITLGYDGFPRKLLALLYPVRYYENGNWYRLFNARLDKQWYFPTPPYPYYNIFKAGLRITPMKDILDFYLDYTRNSFEKAGPVDDNMNHVGFLVSFTPMQKLAIFLRYTYSRWQDIESLIDTGNTKVSGHHNAFAQIIYRLSEDQDFTFQYGENAMDPYMGGMLDIAWDPYGGSLSTIDTQHIFRLYYRRRF